MASGVCLVGADHFADSWKRWGRYRRVDSCTQAIRFLKDQGWLDINPEPHYDDEYYADAKPKRENPYAI